MSGRPVPYPKVFIRRMCEQGSVSPIQGRIYRQTAPGRNPPGPKAKKGTCCRTGSVRINILVASAYWGMSFFEIFLLVEEEFQFSLAFPGFYYDGTHTSTVTGVNEGRTCFLGRRLPTQSGAKASSSNSRGLRFQEARLSLYVQWHGFHQCVAIAFAKERVGHGLPIVGCLSIRRTLKTKNQIHRAVPKVVEPEVPLDQRVVQSIFHLVRVVTIRESFDRPLGENHTLTEKRPVPCLVRV